MAALTGWGARGGSGGMARRGDRGGTGRMGRRGDRGGRSRMGRRRDRGGRSRMGRHADRSTRPIRQRGEWAVIVVAGEALIDLLPIPGGQHHFDARPGGAPCNVAVGLARLGRRTCFLGRIGPDAFGRMLRQHLKDADVDLSMVVPASEPTTLGVAALDGHGKAEYSFYANGTADWQWAESEVPDVLPADVRALYVGGLALRFLPGAAVLEGLMRRARLQERALIFFDPNVRSGFEYSADAERSRVERQVKLTHVIKASEDDIALLYPGQEYREIAAAWQRTTAGIVVVTLGAEGVYALAPGGAEIMVPAVPTDVVDTVGAGDAFASA